MALPQATNGTLVPRNDFLLCEEHVAVPYHTYKGYSKIVVPTAFEHGPEDRHLLARLIAKGESCCNPRICPGQIVLIGKWDGARFRRDEKSYILVKEDQVLAVIE